MAKEFTLTEKVVKYQNKLKRRNSKIEKLKVELENEENAYQTLLEEEGKIKAN
jgi:hypothetical protein